MLLPIERCAHHIAGLAEADVRRLRHREPDLKGDRHWHAFLEAEIWNVATERWFNGVEIAMNCRVSGVIKPKSYSGSG